MLRQGHQEWLEQVRKIDPEIAVRQGLHSAGHRIAFPFLNVDEEVGFTKFLDPDPKEGASKWTAKPGGTPCLFNEPVIRDHKGAPIGLIITEGELDCLSAIQAGFPHAVSIPNGAFTKPDDARMDHFRRVEDYTANWKWIILALDDDAKGHACRDILIDYFTPARCKVVKYPDGCKDLNDVAQKLGNEAVANVIRTAKPQDIPGVYKLSNYPKTKPKKFHQTDIPDLGEKFAPYRGGLVTIFGPSYHGKSTFLIGTLGDWVMKYGLKICMAALEEPLDPWLREKFTRYYSAKKRRITTMADIHKYGLSSQRLPSVDKAMQEMADAWIEENFTFLDCEVGDDDAAPTLDWLLEAALSVKIRHGMDVLVIDPWNKVDFEGSERDSYTAEKKALRKIKHFARRQDIILIVVTHPNRGISDRDGKQREPAMWDIAGGQHWESMSDLSVGVFRPDLESPMVSISVEKAKFYSSGIRSKTKVLYQRGIEYFLRVSADFENVDGQGLKLPDKHEEPPPKSNGHLATEELADIPF